MVASDGFAEFLREQLAPLGRVTMRRMFGKTGVFCNGLMFGMVTNDTLYFRVDDHNRAVFKEAESAPPLNNGQHQDENQVATRMVTVNAHSDWIARIRYLAA